MSKNLSPSHVSEAEFRDYVVQFVGGSTAVTKVFGNGLKVTYISTGLVDLTWQENPGVYLGCVGSFQATTASALKGYTFVPGAWNATTWTLRLSITGDGGGSAPALVDLAALQWLNLRVSFKECGPGV